MAHGTSGMYSLIWEFACNFERDLHCQVLIGIFLVFQVLQLLVLEYYRVRSLNVI
jgi:hypothetical protein